jgi:hypothetical protein
MKQRLAAILVLAIAFQASLGCALASVANGDPACCGTSCPQKSSTNHGQCCKASPWHETAEVSPARSGHAPLCEAVAIAAPARRLNLDAPGVVTASSNRASPATVVLDQLCSLQI